MFKTIIIDDEKANREGLCLDLRTYCPELTVVALCSSATEGISAINYHQPEIVFLDIEMPEMNGFKMLEHLPKLDFALVFITAYQQYAIDAFEKNAIAYLLKPVSPKKLKAAVKKAISKHLQQAQLSNLLNTIEQLKRKIQEDTIILKAQEGEVSINTSSILYAESDGNYCRIFMENGTAYFVSHLMKSLVEKLPDYFCRIHRQIVINRQQIHSYLASDGGWVLLSNGVRLKVSRRFRKAFLEEYHHQ